MNFPLTAYGVDRREDGGSIMPEITRRMTERLAGIGEDKPVDGK